MALPKMDHLPKALWHLYALNPAHLDNLATNLAQSINSGKFQEIESHLTQHDILDDRRKALRFLAKGYAAGSLFNADATPINVQNYERLMSQIGDEATRGSGVLTRHPSAWLSGYNNITGLLFVTINDFYNEFYEELIELVFGNITTKFTTKFLSKILKSDDPTTIEALRRPEAPIISLFELFSQNNNPPVLANPSLRRAVVIRGSASICSRYGQDDGIWRMLRISNYLKELDMSREADWVRAGVVSSIHNMLDRANFEGYITDIQRFLDSYESSHGSKPAKDVRKILSGQQSITYYENPVLWCLSEAFILPFDHNREERLAKISDALTSSA